MLRRLLKKSGWPELYCANIPVHTRKPKQNVIESVPMLLPHELVAAFHKNMQETMCCLEQRRHGRNHSVEPRGCEEEAGHQSRVRQAGLPTGFRLNGIMSLPGLGGKYKNVRSVLFGEDECWFAKGATFDAVLKVMTWSQEHAAANVSPARRHDVQPWWTSDRKRQALAGTPLRCHALLCQVIGDWLMHKQVFRFPQHDEGAGCCFLCTVWTSGICVARWQRADQRLGH